MVYLTNLSLISTDVPFECIVLDDIDGNFYKISLDENGNVYSELSMETTEKQWIMTDTNINKIYKLGTIDGSVVTKEIDISAITSSIDLTDMKAKLDILLICACKDKDENTTLPFKMYGIE